MIYIHTMEYYSAICSNMDGSREHHIKWSKSNRGRQILYDITYMWNLRNNTNESIYKTETDSDIEKKLMVTKGESQGRKKLSMGLTKLLYTE